MRLSYLTLVEFGMLGDEKAKQASDAWMKLYLLSCRTTAVLVVAWWEWRRDQFHVATARPGNEPWKKKDSTCCMI